MPPSPSFLIFLFIKYIFDTLFLSIICVWLKGSIICFCDLVLLAQTGWSLMSNNIITFIMAHQCDCDFEAGKRECEVFYLQHSYIRHIHKSKTHYCAHWSNHRLWVISCSTSKPYLIFTCFYLFRVSPAILKTFYSGAIESVLTQCISVWYSNATNKDCKALQRVVRFSWTHPCLYIIIKSTVYCIAQCIVLHILLIILFFLPIFIYISLVFYIFCNVHWADLSWFTFHYWLYSV